MNEVVKYDNYMNNLKFTGFTAMDFNFLMLLCSKLRDKDISKAIIPFSELREKTGYTQCSTKQFVSDLERMNDKLMKVTCKLRTEKEIIMFVLFPTFRIDVDNQLLIVAVNKDFQFILNELVKNFTRFELKDFIQLDSKYSKNLYRLLKQYRHTGRYEVALEDFCSKMDIPKAYENKRIMDDIIKPVLKELKSKQYFQELKCTVQYARKRGRPVTGYTFTFTPEERIKDEKKEEKSENNIKASKNRFNNIEPRKYNYEELERALLGH